jgi:hypothetical protein
MNQNYVYNKSKGMFVFKLLSRAWTKNLT